MDEFLNMNELQFVLTNDEKALQNSSVINVLI